MAGWTRERGEGEEAIHRSSTGEELKMRVVTRCVLVCILVALSLPGAAAKKHKKQARQKKAKVTATPAATTKTAKTAKTATPTPTPAPAPAPIPRQGTLLWGEARAGMTEDEVLKAFPGKAEVPAKGVTVSEEGTYTGATIKEAQESESSFDVSFVFKSPEKTLERVTLGCTECYASEFSKVKRKLIEKYGNPVADETPSRDRRRTIWIAEGLKIQLGWLYTNLLGREIKVLSINYSEAEKEETGRLVRTVEQ